MSVAPRLQVLIPVPAEPPSLAGVPAAVRTARFLSEEGRVFLLTRRKDSLGPWSARLGGLAVEEVGTYNGHPPVRDRLDPRSPLLLLAAGGFPRPERLLRFLEESRAAGSSSAWVWKGRVVAAYHPSAETWPRDAPPSREFPLDPGQARSRRSEAAAEDWESLEDEEARAGAEERFFQSLASDSDGYLARMDRRLSIALSRRLIGTPVTPNQITAFSLVLGLAGSALLASGAYWTSVAGAATLWLCCILDGCDGEVARLKLLSSPFGARFDVIADSIVHLAIFAAIPLHVRARDPGAEFLLGGLVLGSGVLLSMFWVWRLILRRPRAALGSAAKVYERIASRDFIYLVAALTVAQRLEWFLWSAAVGAHFFWLSLVAVSLRQAARKGAPAA